MEPSLLVVLVIFFSPLLFALLSRLKRKKIEKQLSELQAELQKHQLTSKTQQQEMALLQQKYSPITDMELHIQKLQDEAEEEIEARKTSVEIELGLQEAETTHLHVSAKQQLSEAREKLKSAKEKASHLVEDARSQSAQIIAYAENQAKEIAGDAFEAKAKADSYEKAIRAMRNTIEGYKDDYIIPNHSVLDDLAEEFSFKEAGMQLKEQRKNIKAMVKSGYAGECDYVEEHRKTYAIHFAVDAFNGKVDTALSKAKHDNYGKIKQEIIDAFALVNHNGQPFRNARIRQEYLDARLTELKWAVATHELRQQEQLEQKELRQQMREEEKARREMERAIKEAEKEERLLQKALEKARSELQQASAEQKQQFEEQLAELETKLQEAEEKGQRALSMAQQTRKGHVYVISNLGSFGENIFKIGLTRRLEPMDRVKELGDASVPFPFDVHAMIYCEDAPTLEKELHQQFDLLSVNKVNKRKEFFNVSLAEIKQAIEAKGVKEVHWTIKAEAAEYRESLAIAKDLQAAEVA